MRHLLPLFVLLLALPAAASEDDAPSALLEERRALQKGAGELFFAPGAIGLDGGQVERLKRRLPHLRGAPDGWRIVVEGHADAVGGWYENDDLARTRAEHVARLLVKAGIPEERILVVARGEVRPIAENGTKEGRAANRRVVLRVRPAAAAELASR